jgi:hypothetical protein
MIFICSTFYLIFVTSFSRVSTHQSGEHLRTLLSTCSQPPHAAWSSHLSSAEIFADEWDIRESNCKIIAERDGPGELKRANAVLSAYLSQKLANTSLARIFSYHVRISMHVEQNVVWEATLEKCRTHHVALDAAADVSRNSNRFPCPFTKNASWMQRVHFPSYGHPNV